MFDQPSNNSWLKPADHNGHLLLITAVHEVDTEHFDSMKNANVTRMLIDVVDLDQNPAILESVNNSHPGIVGKLGKLSRGGNPVLGRMTQVPSTKGNPAWVLGEYKDGDAAKAQAWLDANKTDTFAQPANTQQAPKPAPASTPAAAPAAAPEMVTLPDGSTVTKEIAELLNQVA